MPSVPKTCSFTKAHRILILGGGFGGTYAALELEKHLAGDEDVEVTMVTRDNYFLFTPMLHEIAASDLEVSNIVSPLRKMLRRVKTFVGSVESIDVTEKFVEVSHGFDGHRHRLSYDHLIVALGSTANYFGLPGVEGGALPMRTIADGMALRNRIISHLEEANSECAATARGALLTFVVAGGGFAGVETMGAINDFVREALPYYPSLAAKDVRMVLVAPDNFILPELGERLGKYSQQKLADRGVEILTGARVKGFQGSCVELNDGRKIPAGTLVWTAGSKPNPLLATLGLPLRQGRLEVEDTLAVRGANTVWAVGDCASISDGASGYHPPTAQHALREGRAAARNVVAALRGKPLKPFRFKTLGQLAAIGRRAGVARIFGINFSGFFAWWLWRTIYLGKLPRVEKKVRVALDWTLDLCFAKDFACVRQPH